MTLKRDLRSAYEELRLYRRKVSEASQHRNRAFKHLRDAGTQNLGSPELRKRLMEVQRLLSNLRGEPSEADTFRASGLLWKLFDDVMKGKYGKQG